MIKKNEFCYFLTKFGDNACLVVVFEFFLQDMSKNQYSVNEMRCKFAIDIRVLVVLFRFCVI